MTLAVSFPVRLAIYPAAATEAALAQPKFALQ